MKTSTTPPEISAENRISPWLTEFRRDRLFNDVDVSHGSGAIRVVIASGGFGKTMMFLCSRHALQEYSHGLLESCRSRHVLPKMSVLNESRDDLHVSLFLDCAFYHANDARNSFPLPALGDLEALNYRAACLNFDSVLLWPRRGVAFAIPVSPNEQPSVLLTLLSTLDTFTSTDVLEAWLDGLINKKVSLPLGLPADSPALAIIKRITDLDPIIGFSYVQQLFNLDSDFPFRVGYFHISLVGMLLTRSSGPVLRHRIRDWTSFLLVKLSASKDTISCATQVHFGLIASVLALQLISDENDVSATERFESNLRASLNYVKDEEEQRFFLQFMVDTLSQHIDSNNIALHWVKMLVLFKYVADEDSVVWPQIGLMKLLRETFSASIPVSTQKVA
jgi:hypothetical protein